MSIYTSNTDERASEQTTRRMDWPCRNVCVSLVPPSRVCGHMCAPVCTCLRMWVCVSKGKALGEGK